MKKVILGSLIAFAIGLVSCSDNEEHNHEGHDHEHHDHDHEGHDHSEDSEEEDDEMLDPVSEEGEKENHDH